MTNQQKTDDLGDWMVKRTTQALRMIENGSDADEIYSGLGAILVRRVKLQEQVSQPAYWDSSFLQEAIKNSSEELKPMLQGIAVKISKR